MNTGDGGKARWSLFCCSAHFASPSMVGCMSCQQLGQIPVVMNLLYWIGVEAMTELMSWSVVRHWRHSDGAMGTSTEQLNRQVVLAMTGMSASSRCASGPRNCSNLSWNFCSRTVRSVSNGCIVLTSGLSGAVVEPTSPEGGEAEQGGAPGAQRGGTTFAAPTTSGRLDKQPHPTFPLGARQATGASYLGLGAVVDLEVDDFDDVSSG